VLRDLFGAVADLGDGFPDLVGRNAELACPPFHFVIFMDVDVSAILRAAMTQVISHKASPSELTRENGAFGTRVPAFV
jgi:hypothetical protein